MKPEYRTTGKRLLGADREAEDEIIAGLMREHPERGDRAIYRMLSFDQRLRTGEGRLPLIRKRHVNP